VGDTAQNYFAQESPEIFSKVDFGSENGKTGIFLEKMTTLLAFCTTLIEIDEFCYVKNRRKSEDRKKQFGNFISVDYR